MLRFLRAALEFTVIAGFLFVIWAYGPMLASFASPPHAYERTLR